MGESSSLSREAWSASVVRLYLQRFLSAFVFLLISVYAACLPLSANVFLLFSLSDELTLLWETKVTLQSHNESFLYFFIWDLTSFITFDWFGVILAHYAFCEMPHRCSDGLLFRPHVVRCTNITDIQLLTASSIPFKMNINREMFCWFLLLCWKMLP